MLRSMFVYKTFLLSIGLVSVLGSFAAYGQSVKTAIVPLSRQEVLQELAITQRLLADEEFLGGDRADAAAEYKVAADTVSKLSTEGGFLTDANIQLQKDEIEYRKLLLEREESFWGLEFYARPVNPVAMVGQFESTFVRFKEVVTDVNNLADKLNDKTNATYSTEDQQLQNERDQRVAELQQGIADVRLRDSDVRRAMYQDRKAAIQARQAQLVADIDALQKQISDRSASISATLTSALTEAVGLPPNATSLLTNATKGDYGGVISTVVQQYATAVPDVTSALPSQLKDIAANAQHAAQQYQTLQQTVTDVRDKADQTAKLLKAIQSNDRDQLVSVGQDVVSRLSPQTRQELLAGMRTVKTFDGVLQLAGSGTAVRAQLASYMTSTPEISNQIGSLLQAYLQTQNPSFALHYQQLLMSELSRAKDASEQAAVLSALSRGWTRSFVRDVLLPQGNVALIAAALGSSCKGELDCSQWLIDHIGAGGFSGPMVTFGAGGDVTLSANGAVIARFSLADVGRATAGRTLEASLTSIQSDVDVFVARIVAGGNSSLTQFVRQIPDVDFDQQITPILNSLSSEQRSSILQALTNSGSNGASAATATDMATLVVGQEVANKTIFVSAANGVLPSAGGDPVPPAGSTDPSEQIMLNAMKASGPYGYAAAVAIQLLAGVAQNGVAIDQINAKAKEDHDLTVETFHISAFESDLNRDEAIAALEQRIATTQASTASSRSDLYEQALVDQGSQITVIQAKIRRRLPLIFLLSEQLRAKFDSVDHAIGFWENDLKPQGQYLERTIRSDSQFRRLGLDPDIGLYSWFKRDSEGQRQDLDALLVHWQGVEAIVSTLCAKLHCAKNDAQMGQVEMTDVISLRTLVGPSAWQAAASSRSLLFTLLPQSLPDTPDRNGLRLVHVAGAVADKSNNYRVNPNITLRHSGLGYISSAEGGYREIMETSAELTPKLPLEDSGASDLQQKLQGRWASNVKLGPVEGYPLYGLYKVKFPMNFNFQISDLVLRFYYQFQDNVSTATSTDGEIDFSCVTAGGHRVPVSSVDMRLIMKKDATGKPSIGGPQACKIVEEGR